MAFVMPITVFFSWQADTPTREGRNFVEAALKRAVSRIGQDATVEEVIRELAVESGAQGAPGSPPIVETIFRRIDRAAVFVPDLTFIAKRPDGRPTPNPNVLIEYGWALNSLSYGRIVPVMNTASGAPTREGMPFDIGHLRFPILYNCPANADDETRRRVKEDLAKEIEARLREVLSSDEFKESLPRAPEPSPFPEHAHANTPSRFRPPGVPIGEADRRVMGEAVREITLTDDPAIWLRVMPSKNPGRTWLVTELEKQAASSMRVVLPVFRAWRDYGFLREHDGFGVYAPLRDQDTTQSVVFLFTTGEIWSIDTYLSKGMAEQGNLIPPVEDLFRTSLQEYAEVLVRLGIEPPFRWIGGMENLKGRSLFERAPSRTCRLDVIVAEGLHSPGDPLGKSLKPFLVKLYDACGVVRAPGLDN
jgi:hypothetical protein